MNITTNKKYRKTREMLFVRQRGEKVVYCIAFAFLALYAILLLAPMLMIFFSSFKDSLVYNEELFKGTIYNFPDRFYFSNYVRAFSLMKVPLGLREVGLPEMVFNTFWIAIGSSVCVVFAQLATGYVCARYKSIFTRGMEIVSLAMLVIPIYGNTGMFMKLIQWLGLYDRWILVFATAFNGFGFSLFIIKGFFSSVSWEYGEAVFIDGGGHFTVFFKIMLPQVMPLALVFFINNFLAQYADYTSRLLYMPSYITISVGLYYESMLLPRIGETPVYFAALFMSCIPILLIYIFLGKRMMTSMNVGGLKG